MCCCILCIVLKKVYIARCGSAYLSFSVIYFVDLRLENQTVILVYKYLFLISFWFYDTLILSRGISYYIIFYKETYFISYCLLITISM